MRDLASRIPEVDLCMGVEAGCLGVKERRELREPLLKFGIDKGGLYKENFSPVPECSSSQMLQEPGPA